MTTSRPGWKSDTRHPCPDGGSHGGSHGGGISSLAGRRAAGVSELAQVTNAILTRAGLHLLTASAPGHVAKVRELVVDALSPAELRQLCAASERILERIEPGEFPGDVKRGTIGDHVEPPAEDDLVVRPLLLGLHAHLRAVRFVRESAPVPHLRRTKPAWPGAGLHANRRSTPTESSARCSCRNRQPRLPLTPATGGVGRACRIRTPPAPHSSLPVSSTATSS